LSEKVQLIVEHARRRGIWNRAHYLNRMTMRELVVAYFQYYAIQGYLLVLAATVAFAFLHPPGLAAGLGAAGAAVVIYPLAGMCCTAGCCMDSCSIDRR